MKSSLSVLLCSALLLTACGDKSQNTASEKTQAPVATQEQGKVYKVGAHLNYLPFHYKDEKGNALGFEMELIQEVAKAGGFNIQINDATPDQRKNFATELNNGTFDVWASTISINPERAAQVDFSEPFLDFENVVHVHADSPIQTPEQLKGKKIAVSQLSKSAPELAAKLNGDPTQVILSETFFAALKQLYLMKTDAVLGDSRVLAYYAQQNQDGKIQTRVVSLGEAKKEFAFAVQKGNTELVNKLNDGLKKVRENGTLQQLEQKWFGNTNQTK